MVPRHDKTSSLAGNNTSATRLRYSGSSSTTCCNESLRQPDILSRNYTSVREDSKKRKPSQSTKLKKVSFNLKNALRSGQVALSDSEYIEHDALMWKLKRMEIQAQAREVKRKLHKQNQEIRQKRRELQHLKTIEKQLLEWLETCDDSEEISQEKQATAFDSMITANVNRMYMVVAAFLSFFLLRFVSYGSFAVNRL